MLKSAIPGAVLARFMRAVLLASVCAAIAPSHAQSPTGQAVNRADLLRTEPAVRDNPYQTATTSDENYVPVSPNDPDLGEQAILKRQDSYKAFNVGAGAPIFYTSNAALSSTNEQGDVIFSPAVGFSYAPRINPALFANFSVGFQEFYYDRFDALDFGSLDVRAGLTYLLPKLHDLSLHAEYAYNRLMTEHTFDEFFSSHGFGFTADLPFHVGRAQQFSVGADAFVNIHSEPAEPGRNDFDVYVAYAVFLTRAVTLNAVARFGVRDYTDINRTDVGEVLSLGATYRFAQWWNLSLTGTFAHSDSNQDVFDYNVANIGGALSFSFRF
jgi:hypothetical protein